jgi:hypothetical protein
MGKRIAAIAGAMTEELGRRLGRFLTRPSHAHGTAAPTDPTRLMGCLQAGDVLLVEGTTRIAMAIRYLTQSTWSHAALYVGNALRQRGPSGKAGCFIEADLANGVRAVDVSEFKGLHCRVCRPVGLNSDEIERVVGFAVDQIGRRYDLKNIVDLARYLLPEPPVPRRWRRRMLALGSGDPTKAICSTLIAEAFQVVRYPVLPIVESVPLNDPHCPGCVAEILHARHHSLYTPRDFDVSPYFAIVKPTLAAGFDPHVLVWNDSPRAIAPPSDESPTGTIVARISH